MQTLWWCVTTRSTTIQHNLHNRPQKPADGNHTPQATTLAKSNAKGRRYALSGAAELCRLGTAAPTQALGAPVGAFNPCGAYDHFTLSILKSFMVAMNLDKRY